MAPCRVEAAPRGFAAVDDGRGVVSLSTSSRDVLVDRRGNRVDVSDGPRVFAARLCTKPGILHALLPRRLDRYAIPASMPHAAEMIELGDWEKTSWSERRYTRDF